jgi:hypothetical protein
VLLSQPAKKNARRASAGITAFITARLSM